MIHRFCDDRFQKGFFNFLFFFFFFFFSYFSSSKKIIDFLSTVGLDMKSKKINLDDKEILLNITDTVKKKKKLYIFFFIFFFLLFFFIFFLKGWTRKICFDRHFFFFNFFFNYFFLKFFYFYFFRFQVITEMQWVL